MVWNVVLLTCLLFASTFAKSIKDRNLARVKEFFKHPKDMKSNPDERIFGGFEASPHAYPFQVALLIFNGNKTFFCGGTLYSNHFVLTAAHCLEGHPDYISVWLGAHDITKRKSIELMLNTTTYIIHEYYNAFMNRNDIALIKLPGGVTFTKNIKPVEIAKGNKSLVGAKGTVIGWGTTEYKNSNSDVLREVENTIMSNDACAATNWFYDMVISSEHICTSRVAPEGNVGGCTGDSGGPLLVKGVQVGIVSFAGNNCGAVWPTVNVRVSEYNDWIVYNTKDGASPLERILFAEMEQNVTKAHKYFSHPKDVKFNKRTRVIKGHEVTPHKYPFQVALEIYEDDGQYDCGGTLYSNRFVLTAAHCLEGNINYILVKLGAHDISDHESIELVMEATKYVIHKRYNRNILINDIALVQLPKRVNFTNRTRPVEIAKGSNTYAGENGKILGWGDTEDEESPHILREVESTIMSNDECAGFDSENQRVIKHTQVCTSGEGNVGGCDGDSGGPLLANGVQIGILSFAGRDCMLGRPTVFTRVTEYNDWIVQNTEGAASSREGISFAIALCLVHFLK